MYLYKEKYLPINREIRNSLQSIYGVGKHKSNLVVARIGLGYPFFINNLNLYNFYFLVSSLDCWTWLEVRIRREIKQKVRFLIDIGCYKGYRHKEGLPCRGQRTRTNAGTKKHFILKKKRIN